MKKGDPYHLRRIYKVRCYGCDAREKEFVCRNAKEAMQKIAKDGEVSKRGRWLCSDCVAWRSEVDYHPAHEGATPKPGMIREETKRAMTAGS